MKFPIEGARVYRVGGSVRDSLLGLSVQDHDYVVVGATHESMQAAGFSAVGKSFSVYLHPETSEEYALALHASPEEALTHDLMRRDLTINAMALDEEGTLIDPYGGMDDLKNRQLRHTGDSFSDDPIRVVRVARFAARFLPLGFKVAPITMKKMKDLVQAGALEGVPSERIWAEFEKVTVSSNPSVFLQVLRECGALAVLAPEVNALYGVPQNKQHHPEVDTGVHTEMVLDMAVRLAPGNVAVAYAALTHDLGKALTPPDQWPAHINHEKDGIGPLSVLNRRWGVPASVSFLAEKVCQYHLHAHRAFEMRPGKLLSFFENLDVFRRPGVLDDFLLACEADKRGRLGLMETDYPQAAHLKTLFDAAKQVSARQFVDAGFTGPEVGERLSRARLIAIHDHHKTLRKPQPSRPKP